MLVPLSWLKDYVDIDVTIDELEEKLFSSGFEVEEVKYLGEEVQNVVTGKITHIEKHQDIGQLRKRNPDCNRRTECI